MMRIYCDFDGTITNRDSIVFLTEYFGAGSEFREEVFTAIKSGKMSVFEAIRLEMETVKITWEAAAQALKKNIHIDPAFPKFVEWTKEIGVELTVLSSGMEPVLELFIGDLQIPFLAHHVSPLESGWIYERIPAHDKKLILEGTVCDGPLIFIGDGTSDLPAIPYAEILFARKDYYLSEYCLENDIPHLTFEGFMDVQNHLESINLKDYEQKSVCWE